MRSLLDSGALSADWADTFRAVPRAWFLPDLIWAYDMGTGRSVPISRAEEPDAWERAAYANVPLVTQWDDGRHSGTEPGVVATSSASMPSVVAAMLRDLDVSDGMRVLEIGTGTGWNAALLAHRLGSGNVVSVEIDAEVVARARAALGRVGLGPEVIHGDGRDGWAGSAPYDRVIATAGVRDLPPRWLEQTRPGGVVLAPWGTHYSDQDALVRLTVGDDGGASGPGGRYESVRFLTGLRVPDCAHVVNRTGEAAGKAWFFDLRGRSWAVAEFREGEAGARVHQSGPRRLWDEVEAAVAWWVGRGRPGVERFGLAVGPDGLARSW
ncbi:hypothetical protein M877_19660 [Streptomyces niveus NCIMB 11891]|nr:hypothetical protein M877_19660 [Streptomyces niveus NCIMB 11891]